MFKILKSIIFNLSTKIYIFLRKGFFSPRLIFLHRDHIFCNRGLLFVLHTVSFFAHHCIVWELSFLICFSEKKWYLYWLLFSFLSLSFYCWLPSLSSTDRSVYILFRMITLCLYFSSSFSNTLEVKLDKIMFLISFCVTFSFGFEDSLSSEFALTSLASSWEFWEKLDYLLSSESILVILIFSESSLLENIILSWEFSNFDSSILFRWDCCLS